MGTYIYIYIYSYVYVCVHRGPVLSRCQKREASALPRLLAQGSQAALAAGLGSGALCLTDAAPI